MFFDKIIFEINKNQRLEIFLPTHKKNLCSYKDIQIIFFCDKESFLLYEDYTYGGLHIFRDTLERELNADTDDITTNNIGILWNDYLAFKHNKNVILSETKEGNKYWIGQDYLIWESLDQYDTWIYNKNNEIFLEITPIYKWHYKDPEKEDKDYLTYEDFKKIYKPTLITKIEKETAKQWINEIDELIEIIKINDLKKDHC